MKKFIYAKIFIVLLLLFIFSFLFVSLKITHLKNKEEEITEGIKNTLENIEIKENSKETIFQDESIGLLIIPSLGIEAPIREGTDKEILKYSVRTF